MRAATGATVNQLRNEGRLPANVLVLTYNNLLRGYIAAVAEEELADYADDVRLYVMTFDKWAYAVLGWQGPLPIEAISNQTLRLAAPFPRDAALLISTKSVTCSAGSRRDLPATTWVRSAPVGARLRQWIA